MGVLVGEGVVETVGVAVVIGERMAVVEGETTVLVDAVVGKVDDLAQDVSSTRKSSIQEHSVPMRCVNIRFLCWL